MRNSKLIVSAAIAISTMISVGAASAADIAARPYTKAPVAPVMADDWSGFYIGGNIGWGSGGPSQTITDIGTAGPPLFLNTTFNNNADSVLGGIHLGYNWQVAPTWLVGIEGDVTWTHINRSGSLGPPISSPNFQGNLEPFSLSSNTQLSALASFRGRTGYTTPNWLAYFTGGAAWARTKTSGNVVCADGGNFCDPGDFQAPLSSTATRFGYVVGAGFEYKTVGSPWIFGFEYLHYHFGGTHNAGTSGYFFTSNGAPAFDEGDCPGTAQCVAYSSGSFNVETVRARVSYKFGGPVVAKY